VYSDLTPSHLAQFKENLIDVAALKKERPFDLFPHISRLIYGVECEQTAAPIIISSFTGAGKTWGLAQWLAQKSINGGGRNFRAIGRPRLIIAFKERKLLAEFVCMFKDALKPEDENEYKHSSKYIKFVYGDPADNIKRLEAECAIEPNDSLKRVIRFLKTATASTRMSGKQRKELEKATIIFTTHESLLNMAAAGLTNGRDIICDEAPDNWYLIHEITQEQQMKCGSLEAAAKVHYDSLLYDGRSIDLAKAASTKVGKRIDSEIFRVSDVHPLSYEEARALSRVDSKKIPYKEHIFSGEDWSFSCARSASDTSEGSSELATSGFRLKEGDVSAAQGKVVETPPCFSVPDVANKKGTHNQKEKPLKPTAPAGFFVSWADLSAFKANSITFLTACPQGTSLAWLQRLDKTRYQTFEPASSAARRKEVYDISEMIYAGVHVSCSKANAESEAAKAIVNAYIVAAGAHKKDSFVIAHGWLAGAFTEAGIATCKSNQTGSNTFRNKHFAIVASLSFVTPRDKLIAQKIFGEEFEEYEKFYMASSMGQSIMRGSLRLVVPEKCCIVYSDKRVQPLWLTFCGM
jgi:hypothetical protein